MSVLHWLVSLLVAMAPSALHSPPAMSRETQRGRASVLSSTVREGEVLVVRLEER